MWLNCPSKKETPLPTRVFAIITVGLSVHSLAFLNEDRSSTISLPLQLIVFHPKEINLSFRGSKQSYFIISLLILLKNPYDAITFGAADKIASQVCPS